MSILISVFIFIVLVNFATNFFLYPQFLKIEDKARRLEERVKKLEGI
jgi:hypothetical protein